MEDDPFTRPREKPRLFGNPIHWAVVAALVLLFLAGVAIMVNSVADKPEPQTTSQPKR